MDLDEKLEELYGGDHIFADGDGGFINICDETWEDIKEVVMRELEEQ